MAIYSVQHSLQGNSGLAEDRFVNTIHVIDIPLETADFPAIAEAMRQFYRPTTGQGPANYMSNAANAPGRSIKIYDLSDGLPRTPVYEVTDSAAPWTDSAIQPLPSEVAVCLSFKGADESGEVPARRRGRMYIGPLQVNAMTTSTSNAAMVAPTFISELALAAIRLRTALEAAGVAWVVYSPTNDPTGVGVAGSATVLTTYWIDNAFDTQRRRGESATTRSTGNIDQ